MHFLKLRIPLIAKYVMNFTFTASTDIYVGHAKSLTKLCVPRLTVVFSQNVDAFQKEHIHKCDFHNYFFRADFHHPSQLPAICSAGVTLVVSPLVSLIMDQIMHLSEVRFFLLIIICHSTSIDDDRWSA